VKQTFLQFEWEHASNVLSSLDTVGLLSFPIDKTRIYGHFSSYEEIQKWMDEWIASKDTAFYRRGIAMLPER